MRRIAVIGDSLVNGGTGTGDPWPMQLRTALGSQYDPQNWGYGSIGSAITLNNFWRGYIADRGYDCVVIQTGVNDVGSLTAQQIYDNIAAIVSEAKSAGLKTIICGMMPWKDAAGWSQAEQDVLEAANILLQKDESADFYVDLYDEMEDGTNADELLAAYDSGDGIHPNDAGKARIATVVANAVRQVYTPWQKLVTPWGLSCYIDPSVRSGVDKFDTFVAGMGNIAADGDVIGGLIDFAAAVEFEQATTGFKPLSQTGEQNGRGIAQFDGDDDYLDGGNELPIAFDDAFSVWFVIKANYVGTQAILSKHSGTAGYEFRYDGTNLTVELTNTVTTDQLVATYAMDLHTDYSLVEIHSNGAGTLAGLTVRKDRAVVSGSASVDNLLTSIAVASNVTLGARSGGGSEWLNGNLGAVAVGIDMDPWAKWGVTFALAKLYGLFVAEVAAASTLPTTWNLKPT